ncbi:MAG: CBS domain-containing protein [Alphaproteobacteria bacterium]|nr:CBS domain-containing protein [Alphaproteobacteria bacterium]
MTVKALLELDNSKLVVGRKDTDLLSAVKIMVSKGVNALVVLGNDGKLQGIVTDHDIIKALDEHGGNIASVPISKCMTEDVVGCHFEESLMGALDLMGRHHIRHLVVKESGKVVAVLSIKDVLRRLHEDEKLELSVLKDVVVAARATVSA